MNKKAYNVNCIYFKQALCYCINRDIKKRYLRLWGYKGHTTCIDHVKDEHICDIRKSWPKPSPPLPPPLTKKESVMIKLGNVVQDPITGFEGTVTGIYHYLEGCRRVQVTPKLDKDGKWREAQTFDEPTLDTINDEAYVRKEPDDPGGPKDNPQRIDPVR